MINPAMVQLNRRSAFSDFRNRDIAVPNSHQVLFAGMVVKKNTATTVNISAR